MLKRTISIGLLLIMAFSMAAPMLHINCDMPCCEVKATSCCEKAKTGDASNKSAIRKQKCDHNQFIPIVSGPKTERKSAQVDMDKPIYSMKTDSPKCQFSEKTAFQSQPSDSQAKFSLPLRL